MNKRKFKLEKNKKLHDILLNVFDVLKHNVKKIKFKKMRGLCGMYYGTATRIDVIEINYKKDIIPSLVHEILHHIFQEWSENKVEQYETKLMNIITRKQVTEMIRILGKNI